ncbi:isocitrate dehydrogenase [NAD] subunit gamma, mitochondrial [Musca vetustissima]|uniref:isocitrate dehydrogenase [NAD] subunit gamma, mitochondrial n=1 Tax=Musca vetustissima TaxID=27455 RepID=UPI002AB7A4DF|nr:isocitrate dehydrogenase [NAD] subunit gamma, mitochondrial [Musca vetustissima]
MAVRLAHRLMKTQTPFLCRSYPMLVTKEKTEDVAHTKSSLQKRLTVPEIPQAQYGGRHAVTMLPGGGIGPELMSYVREIFAYCGAPIDFEVIDIDPSTEGNEDLEYAITSIKRNGVAIKGNIETKSQSLTEISRNVAIRNELDLFVNVVHCKSLPGIPAHHKDVDIVLIRQNTDGEYAMLEHESVKGVVESMKVVTVENAERVARYAFQYARENGRKKVTTIHKANIMKMSDGLFLEVAKKVHKDYPELEHNNMIIDNTCMQLVSNPHQFDVMNMTNLYGTIVSNVICGLIGGAGILSGRNYGDHYAIFEPGTRNTGTAIAGKNIANPLAMINASVDMLNHLGYKDHARVISEAAYETVVERGIRTPDIGGTNSSTDVVKSILDILSNKRVHW